MASLERMAEGHPVSFKGTFPSQSMAEVMRDIDVLVIPSRWSENSPFVLTNALATHTPVIVSDLGGMTEFIDRGKSGLAFEVGNATALEGAMRRFVAESQLAAQMSKLTNYERTPRTMVEETLEVYRVVLG